MEVKIPKEEENNATTDAPQAVKEDRFYGILRRCIEKLGTEALLDFMTRRSLTDKTIFEELKKKFVEQKDLRKVFVRNILPDLADEQLQKSLEQFGEIESCTIVRDTKTKKSKGFGFVLFKKFDDAIEALKKAEITINNQVAYIHFASKTGRDENYANDMRSDRQIFVRGLSDLTDSSVLKAFFEKWGVVEDCNVPKDVETGKLKGFGFVKFYAADSAKKALKEPTKLIDGRNVRCDFSSKKRNGSFANEKRKIHRPMGGNYDQYPQMRNRMPQYANPMYAAENLSHRLQDLQMAQAQIVQKMAGGNGMPMGAQGHAGTPRDAYFADDKPMMGERFNNRGAQQRYHGQNN